MDAIFLNEEEEVTVAFQPPQTQMGVGDFIFHRQEREPFCMSLNDAEELYHFIAQYIGMGPPSCAECGAPQKEQREYLKESDDA